MEELLTTKQLQEYLKVDRITVYRMLNDGRLSGIKIGNQWRFHISEINRLLGEMGHAPRDEGSNEIQDFPSDCIVRVQQLFAGLLGIGAVIVTLQGETLHDPEYSNPFCKYMLSHPESRKKCQASWRKIAGDGDGNPGFHTCHAGLNYLKAPITVDEKPAAWLIAGQYRLQSMEAGNEEKTLKRLVSVINSSISELRTAYASVPVLDEFQRRQVVEWTPKVALTFQVILNERKQIMDRLKRISELSRVEKPLSE